MITRILVGILLLIVLIFSFYFQFFNYLVLIIMLLGSYELIKLIKKKPVIVSSYLILFIISMLVCIKLSSSYANIVFLALLVIVFNDSWAYLVGKFFGKTHFTKLSPNKTIEGVIGGIVGTYINFFILSFCGGNGFIMDFSQNNFHIPGLIVIFIICICGIAGDLLESALKRSVMIKDTSNLLGEHGGIVDRVDSWVISMLVLGILFLI